MGIGFLLFWIAPATAYRRGAKRHLQAHFGDESEQVWRTTRTWQSQLAPERPHHSGSAGVDFMIRYLEWSCALYRAVQQHGMSKAEAVALIEAIMTDVYRPVPAAMFKFSRLRSAKREARVRWILRNITGHFLPAPPFCYQHLPSDEGVAFDITRCPFADYFKNQGVPELTEPAAGNLDYVMAQEWGVELDRTQTLADGAKHCDFRWRFPLAD
ncbi:MAG: L-2-amino-thiazoline-4-carboxylic acid hydrolase [Woeseiaceae bacterium]|nr:L-2-amino-thiazoline-4-carboxylic acid hydrolase [Woeseiaceae bacterium]